MQVAAVDQHVDRGGGFERCVTAELQAAEDVVASGEQQAAGVAGAGPDAHVAVAAGLEHARLVATDDDGTPGVAPRVLDLEPAGAGEVGDERRYEALRGPALRAAAGAGGGGEQRRAASAAAELNRRRRDDRLRGVERLVDLERTGVHADPAARDVERLRLQRRAGEEHVVVESGAGCRTRYARPETEHDERIWNSRGHCRSRPFTVSP
jgi:hypothetical protein